MITRQCAILAGGFGTRLGDLTKSVPKPLLPVDGNPFLEILLSELARRGFDDIVLCAGYRADMLIDFIKQRAISEKLNINIHVSIEAEPSGTAGALVNAIDSLQDDFLLLNGDTWFDFNWLDLAQKARGSGCAAGIALREVASPDRYETVALDNSIVSGFHIRKSSLKSGLINGGVYWLTKDIFKGIKIPTSLEMTLLPRLSADRELAGWIYDGFFIDIGIPETYAAAQYLVPSRIRRPAAFLDRDGVLNHDKGYVHKRADFVWVEEAKEGIKLLNDHGYYVFIVTNQAGVGHGYYSEEDVRTLHAWVDSELREMGASIDDWRYCCFHPKAKLEQFRAKHEWRKPAPGMIKDLLLSWPVDLQNSFMIGDKSIDLMAAQGAGIVGHQYVNGSLKNFIKAILAGPVS